MSITSLAVASSGGSELLSCLYVNMIASFSVFVWSFCKVLWMMANSLVEGSSLCTKMVLTPESNISSMLSSVISVSLSTMISLRSMDTTSPVSSSTKSSFHVFRTLAANLQPMHFLRFALVTFTSFARPNISNISLSLSNPIALSNVVTGNFFFRSMYAYMTLLMSVANSIHEPLNGIILAEYSFVPLACML